MMCIWLVSFDSKLSSGKKNPLAAPPAFICSRSATSDDHFTHGPSPAFRRHHGKAQYHACFLRRLWFLPILDSAKATSSAIAGSCVADNRMRGARDRVDRGGAWSVGGRWLTSARAYADDVRACPRPPFGVEGGHGAASSPLPSLEKTDSFIVRCGIPPHVHLSSTPSQASIAAGVFPISWSWPHRPA